MWDEKKKQVKDVWHELLVTRGKKLSSTEIKNSVSLKSLWLGKDTFNFGYVEFEMFGRNPNRDMKKVISYATLESKREISAGDTNLVIFTV